MFPGLADRLQSEIKAMAAPATKVRVVSPPERKVCLTLLA